mmetsp:Transcript_14267/g.33523  ORF Transcript_14267/g.33523 Transcript_14267/m.33523 type:complete len:149 (+) Transcript_14267:2-448(+)
MQFWLRVRAHGLRWTRNFRFGLRAYIQGLFQFVRGRPNYWATLRYMLVIFGSFGVFDQETTLRVEANFLGEGTEDWLLNSWMSDEWLLAPGIPHPAGKKRCEFLVSWELQLLLGVNLCNPQLGVASLRSVCATSCMCRTGMDGCPAAC